MNNADLMTKIMAVENAANELNKAIQELVGPETTPQIAAHAFGAQFHLQDALNRVSNISRLLAQRTDEAVAKTVDDAAAKGQLRVLET